MKKSWVEGHKIRHAERFHHERGEPIPEGFYGLSEEELAEQMRKRQARAHNRKIIAELARKANSK